MNEKIDRIVDSTPNEVPNEAHNHDCEMMAKSGEVLDAILYINLAHREDRKQHVLDEIKRSIQVLIECIELTLCMSRTRALLVHP